MQHKTLPKIFSQDELSALFSVPDTRCYTQHRNRMMMELMYKAGLRVSEVCKLRDEHIVWGEHLALTGGITKYKKDRCVPIGMNVFKRLKEWLILRIAGSTVFTTSKGTAVSPRHIQDWMKRIGEKD